MKLTTKQLKQMIKEELTKIMESEGAISIKQYVESVNYNLDPTLLDLLFSLMSSGLESVVVKKDDQDKIEQLALSGGDNIFVYIYPITEKVYLRRLDKKGPNKLIVYHNLNEAAQDIPLKLDKK